MTRVLAKEFGKQLRYYREHAKQGKKMPLFDLASEMGWKGVSPLVLMEKGERIPRVDTIDGLGKIMGLSVADIRYLKGLAGYIEYTTFPKRELLQPSFDAIEQEISQVRYPVTMIDYQGRYCIVNAATSVVVGSEKVLKRMAHENLSFFDVVFDSGLGVCTRFEDADRIEREQVFRFKAHNLHRRHEPFYQTYPECMRHLLPADYQRFANAWENCKVPVGPADFLKHALHTRLSFKVSKQRIHFDLRSIELLHLDRLFNITYYQPRADVPGNTDVCEALFPRTFIGEPCFSGYSYID